MIFLNSITPSVVCLECIGGFGCGKKCLSNDWRCDGTIDCEGHEDELNCGKYDL